MADVVPLPIVPRDSSRGAALGERSDDDLMRLVRAGRAEALAVLVHRHLGRLAGFCTKLLGDATLADEVCQQTWLQIWTHRASYRDEGKFVVLLFTVARNACRNQARAARRRERWIPVAEGHGFESVADDRAGELDRLLQRERQRALLDALDELPEPMREAVLLRFQEDLGYEDIARIVGVPESTLRSRVHLGLKQLRRHLEKGESR
ncbi:RNA polymerase sigma-54 factor RpoN [Minicystis rosea]|nr:RNA polymerase sigma-54 factor RpoN [Minicystis rosea]